MSTNAIVVDKLSKKFSSSLKRAMIYGLADISRSALLPHLAAPDAGAALRPTEFWALKDVSFTIQKGERVGIIGPNGAGKSTLFSVLSGIYGPSTGNIAIQGRLQALIALGAGFHPTLSGRENIYINAAILGMGSRQVNRIMDDIIAFADIGEFIDAPVKNYSSGMLVRLGFAIAAHMDPDILLIDEILAVGDARFQSKCIGFSKRLAESGRTVIMVSHNLAQVLRVCSRVLWLDKGTVIRDGSAQEVVQAYSNWSLQTTAGEKRTGVGTGAGQAIRFTYETIPTVKVESSAQTDGAGRDLPVVLRGTSLKLKIKYEVLEPLQGKLEFWAHCKDHLSDVRIFGTSSVLHDSLIDVQPGDRGCIVFEFPNLALMDGSYSWDLGASDYSPYGQSGSLAFVLETSPSFLVVSSKEDFYNPYYVSTFREPIFSVPSRVSVETRSKG